MKRSQFCKKVLGPGLACGCAMVLNPGSFSLSSFQDKPPKANPNETSCDEKIAFTQKWVKRFFDQLDENVDAETRTKLMQANGAACASGAYGPFPDREPATIQEIDDTITSWQARVGKENIYRQGNTVFFNYVGNQKGLKISDGYCLCPMTENGPADLSPTYCQCSVGYVKYMFQRYLTFRPVQVELLEALRAGGKACRFKVLI